MIAGRRVGPGLPCYVIAEAGINHNGSLDAARSLVDAAVDAGADAVKFQRRSLPDVYQKAILDNPRLAEQSLQFVLPELQRCELTDEAYSELAGYSRSRDITFLCSPWDAPSVAALERLEVPAYKVGSPDLTNFPLLARLAALRKPLLVSTGMATELEIQRTIEFLKQRRAHGVLLHCVSEYPPAIDEYNLRFLDVLRRWSGWPVGFSAHDLGLAPTLAAVALGASVIERHITLDRDQRGTDHKASLLPDEFREQVATIREVEASLGVPHRWLTQGELMNRRTLGKSLVAARDLPAGTEVAEDMVLAKSPGLHVSPQRIGELLGRRLGRSIRADEPFRHEDLDDRALRSLPRKIDIGLPWGIVVRFIDVEALLPRFEREGATVLEFHVSDRDLDDGTGFTPRPMPLEFVLHVPEYFHERLIDLCADDEALRTVSIGRVQQSIDLARRLADRFDCGPRGPKVVLHVGGMSRTPGEYPLAEARARLLRSLRALEHDGVELLLENLPPFPSLFGGRWYSHVTVGAEATSSICTEAGLGMCLDTSHAALACARDGTSLADYVRRVLPLVRHLHVADAAGVTGEGLQVGEGTINFVELLPLLWQTGATLIPEVWLGHHDGGEGFRVALERLSDLTWAIRATSAHGDRVHGATTPLLLVPHSASVRDALTRIDANRLGIVFVVDDASRVCGAATDGDIRRALLRGQSLDAAIAGLMIRDFVLARDDEPVSNVRDRLSDTIRVVPILDADSRLVDYVSIYPDA